MKVCVLQPDYTGSQVDYRHYDPPRDLSALLPDARIDHVFLKRPPPIANCVKQPASNTTFSSICVKATSIGTFPRST